MELKDKILAYVRLQGLTFEGIVQNNEGFLIMGVKGNIDRTKFSHVGEDLETGKTAASLLYRDLQKIEITGGFFRGVVIGEKDQGIKRFTDAIIEHSEEHSERKERTKKILVELIGMTIASRSIKDRLAVRLVREGQKASSEEINVLLEEYRDENLF